MPEIPTPKNRPHPWTRTTGAKRDGVVQAARLFYCDLHTTTNFTFLTGASHPEELVERAAALGHGAIAITDRNSLGGIVRAHVAAKEAGLPLIVGSRVELAAPVPFSILLYPTSRAAYARLCRLLTLGKRRARKGECHLTLHDCLAHHEDLLAVVVPGVSGPGPERFDQSFIEALHGLRRVFDDDRLSLAASCFHGPDDATRLERFAALSAHTGVPLVATNDIHYHVPARRMLQDVLTAVRHGTTVHAAGFRLLANAERHLKPPAQMAQLFAAYPEAVARTALVAERAAGFSLDEIRYEYPHEVCPPGSSPLAHLRDLALRGARDRYPEGVPAKVSGQIEHELHLIGELAYAPYFLTVHDLVLFARSRGILCQGRGAAANSAVCYCLGVTAVDPERHNLLFERFISRERNEPPDIDIDFEHERREEVIQYIYRKYGRDRAALTAEVISYRGRSAVRDVGKALGLSLDCVDRLARNIDWWHSGLGDPGAMRDLGINPCDPAIQRLRRLVNEILGFPRHLSQHVGGFVITQTPLCELVPIENAAMVDRTVIEWDKDDIDAMGMLKVDCLGLGMLTCIRKAFGLVDGVRGRGAAGEPRAPGAPRAGTPAMSLCRVPPEDPRVYDMICKADTIGVFQIESRAQMSMLPRLRPRSFYDLVIEVAIVRPGPIQGNMVHPYLRRRNGEEPVTYPSEAVRDVLAKTLGVPLFQEQAMSLAIVAAGFTAGEADQLRRAMAAWKRKGDQIERFGRRLVDGMLERGYEREFAERCFDQIKGFSEYGFPESHAASFAHLVYVSAWLKHYHPAAFAAALLNSQPMGFYAPAQIVRDAQEHGVEVRPVDGNASAWDCTIEEKHTPGEKHTIEENHALEAEHTIDEEPASGEQHAFALRLGFRQVKGLRQEDGEAIAEAVRARGPFGSIEALRGASGVRVAALRRLASADAFNSMGCDRQRALWVVRALRDDVLPMFAHLEPEADSRPARLPEVTLPEKVVHDYASTRLSLKAHPVSFLREELTGMGVTCARELADQRRWTNRRSIAVAGLVLVRQRPSTANGIIFMTLEDETGIANLIVSPETYERYRRVARHGVALVARGRVERQGEVVHVKVARLEGLEERLTKLTARSRDFR